MKSIALILLLLSLPQMAFAVAGTTCVIDEDPSTRISVFDLEDPEKKQLVTTAGNVIRVVDCRLYGDLLRHDLSLACEIHRDADGVTIAYYTFNDGPSASEYKLIYHDAHGPARVVKKQSLTCNSL